MPVYEVSYSKSWTYTVEGVESITAESVDAARSEMFDRLNRMDMEDSEAYIDNIDSDIHSIIIDSDYEDEFDEEDEEDEDSVADDGGWRPVKKLTPATEPAAVSPTPAPAVDDNAYRPTTSSKKPEVEKLDETVELLRKFTLLGITYS